MRELALFAGAGGGILGGKLLGWRTVCAVERDAYAASVLAQRQNDGFLGAFPIWSDVCSFDGKPWRGIVDVVSGGFPCQDISVAGKGRGIEGERSGLWAEMFRIICEVRPRFVFVENSPALVSRGLGTVLGDLASVGFDAQWGVLGANDVGAPHKRDRIWVVASNNYSEPLRIQASQDMESKITIGQITGVHGSNGNVADANSARQLPSAKRRNESRHWIGNSGQDVSDSDSAQGVEQEPQQSQHGRPAGLHDRTGSVINWPDRQAEPDVGGSSHGMAEGLDIVGADK